MTDTHVIHHHLDKKQEGSYITLPFTVPEHVVNLGIACTYEHERSIQGGSWTRQEKRSRIDLALLAPDGHLVGSSGSDRDRIEISATESTPGYERLAPQAGTWSILVGAYVLVDEGTDLVYQIDFTMKERRLYKGDLHTHTLASDGILTALELGLHARRHGLDFAAITDHNTFCPAENLPQLEGFTFIPGMEWTHYRGHANFLGLEQPLAGSFHANNPDEVKARFVEAHDRGALIVINHPHDPLYGFHFPTENLPYDAIEVWNGPMRESNLQAIGAWHRQLAAGLKIPACCGSDYHRDNLFQYLGGPCMGVYADSSSAADLLAAIRDGHTFMVYGPDGPEVQLSAGDAILGDSVQMEQQPDLSLRALNLQKDDQILLITADGISQTWTAGEKSLLDATVRMARPGFARIEIHRVFIPGLPPLPALVSNPIYFGGI